MSFDSLPRHLRNQIDQAFDAIATTEQIESGGGFIVEEKANKVPFTQVPIGLQSLDLTPDDEEVLAVFRNAATGWSSASSSKVDKHAASGGWVAREDWRSVCAVLLEPESGEDPEDDDGLPVGQGSNDSDPESDYQHMNEDVDDESDDEYLDGPDSSVRRRSTRTPKASSSLNAPSTLSKRQKEATLEAFTLFFSDVPLSDVHKQRIMIKDIQRVAKLLGEKIKADEMLEMLEAFSTSPDKSISLEDFGRIMVTAKLV